MSFRKRNAVISNARAGDTAGASKPETQLPPGVRPSPLDGRLTTSTGTSSLDHLLAGHVGLPLGTCLLVEEQGTTDFSGVVLRYYAAEGLVQGHQVHALGFTQAWKHELPAVSDPNDKGKVAKSLAPSDDQLKIAWRYKALGNSLGPRNHVPDASNLAPFCHSFDLTKRLASSSCKSALQTVPMPDPFSFDDGPTRAPSPFKTMIKHLRSSLANSGPTMIHRVVIPNLLSPSIYGPGSCQPSEVLQFLYALRALLRQYSTQLTALITLPESLFPRTTGLTRWIELLCDGVVELVPSPANPGAAPPTVEKKDADLGQGFLKVHSLPVYHEKGGGGAETTYFRETLSFSLSVSRGLVIKPYSLPPLGEESKDEKSSSSGVAKDSMEF